MADSLIPVNGTNPAVNLNSYTVETEAGTVHNEVIDHGNYISPSVEDVVASGPSRGFVSAGTAWNKNWSTDYGPDVDRAKKARPEEVREAVEAFNHADSLPLYFDEAVEISSKPLSEILKDDTELIMVAYYQLLRWRKQEDDDIAAILLLM